jgi:hypothetical protein
MRAGDDKKGHDSEAPDREDSLADLALEAIVRSQQIRARSRNLRKTKESSTTCGEDEKPS